MTGDVSSTTPFLGRSTAVASFQQNLSVVIDQNCPKGHTAINNGQVRLLDGSHYANLVMVSSGHAGKMARNQSFRLLSLV
jgi:hypothetical protein